MYNAKPHVAAPFFGAKQDCIRLKTRYYITFVYVSLSFISITYFDSIVSYNWFAIMQPIDLVHWMSRNDTLKLSVFIYIHRLNLWL